MSQAQKRWSKPPEMILDEEKIYHAVLHTCLLYTSRCV